MQSATPDLSQHSQGRQTPHDAGGEDRTGGGEAGELRLVCNGIKPISMNRGAKTPAQLARIDLGNAVRQEGPPGLEPMIAKGSDLGEDRHLDHAAHVNSDEP